jgi:hypothetical protein
MMLDLSTVGRDVSPKGLAVERRLVPRFMNTKLEQGTPAQSSAPWRSRRTNRSALNHPAVSNMSSALQLFISKQAVVWP